MLTFVSLAFIILNSLIMNVSSHTCICAAFTEGECNAQPNCCWWKHVPQAGITQGTRGKCRSHKYLECKVDKFCTITYNDPRLNDNGNEDVSVLSAYNKQQLSDEAYTPPDQDQDNGQAPIEDTVDWPYVCREDVPPTTADDFLDINDDTEFDCDAYNAMAAGGSADTVEFEYEYSEDPIDVSQIEIVAQKLYYERKERLLAERAEKENMVISINNKPGSAYESFTGLQIGAGIVFIVLLLAGMIYWQCNKDKMDKDGLNQNNGFISLTESKDSYSTFNNI